MSGPRKVLVTDAEQFLGPAAVERFRSAGDDVTARVWPLDDRAELASLVAEHGPFDVVVANLDAPIEVAPVTEHGDEAVRRTFGRLVEPLFWIFAECLPAMIEAGDGAVVVPTSATAIRSAAHPIAAYESARAAQSALVRSVGWEMARHGVRVNGIAPNFVENPSYYPPETLENPRFQESVRRDVPAQRTGTGAEAAEVLWWLASPQASYVFGSVTPVDGGWSIG